jgi:hypothetical protein
LPRLTAASKEISLERSKPKIKNLTLVINSHSDSVVREPRSVVRAVLVRLLVYGGIGLAVALWFVDFRALRSRLSNSQPVADEPASADPGWPHVRGPQYTAHSAETDLADSWPEEGPPVLWTREIGRGYSGLIAVGSRLFTQTQSLTEQTVLALDADTGRTIWEHRYGWPYYELTRRLSLAPAWYFMITFLAAWPLAIPAARRIRGGQSAGGDVVWTLGAFSLYFWAAGALMLWRGAIRG